MIWTEAEVLALGRHNRRAIEASATREELAARLIAGSPPWPRARYRVEGSPAGNSALVRRERAEVLAVRFGGQVVEVVPAWRAWRAAGGRR